jgi:hypothetical protein
MADSHNNGTIASANAGYDRIKCSFEAVEAVTKEIDLTAYFSERSRLQHHFGANFLQF